MRIFDYSEKLSEKRRYQYLTLELLLNVRVASVDQILALTYGRPKSTSNRKLLRRKALKWLREIESDGFATSHRVVAPKDVQIPLGPTARCGCRDCVVDWRFALDRGPLFGEPNGWNSLGKADGAFKPTRVYAISDEYYRSKCSIPAEQTLSALPFGNAGDPDGHVSYYGRELPADQMHIVVFEHFLHVTELFLSLRNQFPAFQDHWVPGPGIYTAAFPGTEPDAYLWKGSQPALAFVYGSRLLKPTAVHGFLYERSCTAERFGFVPLEVWGFVDDTQRSWILSHLNPHRGCLKSAVSDSFFECEKPFEERAFAPIDYAPFAARYRAAVVGDDPLDQ